MLSGMEPPISTSPPMSPEDGRRLARQRVWARKQRTRGIRRRVIAITLSLFVAVWVAIFVHLVTGHDPALGASSRPAKAAGTGATSQVSTTTTQAAAPKAKTSAPAAAAVTSAQAASSSTGAGGSSTDSSSSGSGSSGSSSSGSSGSSSGSSSSAAPVTTSQS